MKRVVSAAWSHRRAENSARYTKAAEATEVREKTSHRAWSVSSAKASGTATTSTTAAHRTYRDGRKPSARTTTASSAPAIRPSRRQKVFGERSTPYRDR